MENLEEIIEKEQEEIIEKKKRGRPKGSKNKDKEKENELIKDTFNFPFSMLLDVIFVRFNLSLLNDVERQNLDEAFNRVLEKYITELKFKEEINFMLILTVVLLPRFQEFKQKKEQEIKAQTEKENNEGKSDTEKS